MTWDFGSVLALIVLVAIPFVWRPLHRWLDCHGDEQPADEWPDCFPAEWVAERLYDREKDSA